MTQRSGQKSRSGSCPGPITGSQPQGPEEPQRSPTPSNPQHAPPACSLLLGSAFRLGQLPVIHPSLQGLLRAPCRRGTRRRGFPAEPALQASPAEAESEDQAIRKGFLEEVAGAGRLRPRTAPSGLACPLCPRASAGPTSLGPAASSAHGDAASQESHFPRPLPEAAAAPLVPAPRGGLEAEL